MKVARAEDQEAREKWVKQQAVRHSYGQEDSGDEDDDGNLVRDVGEMIGNEDESTLISGRKCRCGSTTHSRTSHRSCPLNKKKR